MSSLSLSGLLRRHARPAAVGCAASTVHQTCEALVPLAIGLAVEHAIDDGAPPTAILIAVVAILGLFAVLATGGGLAYWVLNATCLRAAHELRIRGIGHVLADPELGRNRRPGELMNIFTTDAKAMSEVIRVIAYLVSGCAGLAVAVVVLLRIDLWLGLGVVLVVPVLVLGIDKLGPWLEQKVQARQHAGGLAAALAAELVQALRPLRSFGGVPEAVRRYQQTSRRSLETALDTASASAVISGVGLLATGVVLVGTAAAAGSMALAGRVTVGEFVTVVVMASFIADPVERIARSVEQFAVSRASAARIAALLSASPRPVTEVTIGALGPLRLREVRLGPIVGLDLTLGSGEMLGIATTDPATADAVTSLFAGQRLPEAGQLCFGEIAMAAVQLRTLRQHLLVEPHTPYLLGGTLSAALDTGRAADPAGAARALAAEVVAGFEQHRSGNAALLPDGGANLSGGQRQRVALARALAAAPAVLVLRDPLTAVDVVTEDAVAEGLQRYRRDSPAATTAGGTVVITTSPPLLSRCDRVVFIDAGEPPVIATHDQLTANPRYAETVLR